MTIEPMHDQDWTDRIIAVNAGAVGGRILEDPDVVIRGERVLHLPFEVHR